MTKRSSSTQVLNKKSKKQKSTPTTTPLGSFLTTTKKGKELVKDEDEFELEEAVFGRSTRASVAQDLSINDYDEEEEEETGLERLQDENLFFFDAPPAAVIASTSKAAPDSEEIGTDEEGEEAEEDEDDEIDWEAESLQGQEDVDQRATDEDDDASGLDSDSDSPKTPAMTTVSLPRSRNLRQAIWVDPADAELQISLTSVARLRKLRQTKDENVVNGLEYETRLRRQFEKMHPPPAWATEARKKAMKRKLKSGQSSGVADASDSDAEVDSDDAREEVDDLFRTTGTSTRRRKNRGAIASGDLDIDRVRDANQADASGSKIVTIGFHPRAQVLFSATDDRRLRLFQIDGTENPLLQTLHVPELPIRSAAYHPSGSSVLLTGPRPYFVSYNLQTGQTVKRTLLTGGLGGSDRASTGGHGGMERFEFSPEGDMLAVGGRRGYVHLVDWGKDGVGKGGQVFGEVKMNVAVKGIAWHKEGKELMTLGEDSEVYLWDVGTRKCVTRWRDDGGFGACGLATDRTNKYTAVASSTGIVNLYDSATSIVPPSGSERKATKAIGNLVTQVSSMKFNHDAQILAIASVTNKDQLKLVHTASATVFSNWPTQQTPLHHVTAIDFSRGSEWLAVGNKRGKVLLYTLKDFVN